MGRYVNYIDGEHIGTTFEQKCHVLTTKGAVEVDGDEYEKDLVCVVDNGPFAAAGYAYCEREFEEFKAPCGRRKRWFKLENVNSHAD